MSDIDALTALKESLWSNFWDNCEYIALFAVFFGVVGEFVAQFGRLPQDPVSKVKLAKASTLLLIAGLGAEMVTYAKTTGITGTIISFLNKEAADAYQRAADDDLLIVALETEVQTRLPKVEQSVTIMQTEFQSTLRPRPINQDDIEAATRTLPKELRTVTLMRVTDPVAGPYAEGLKKALQGLTRPFDVSMLKLSASEFEGVIVCQNSAGDIKVGNALENADIVTGIKPMATAPQCKPQMKQATDDDGDRGPFGMDPLIHGTLIFVGRPVPPPAHN
jgi:hypothetical protein